MAEVEGLEEVVAYLQSFPEEFQEHVTRRAANDLATYTVNYARTIAPKGQTGKLRRTIEKRVLRARGLRFAISVMIRQHHYFGTPFYPLPQEVGTKHMEAKRYLKRAGDAAKAAAPQIWAGAITQAGQFLSNNES